MIIQHVFWRECYLGQTPESSSWRTSLRTRARSLRALQNPKPAAKVPSEYRTKDKKDMFLMHSGSTVPCVEEPAIQNKQTVKTNKEMNTLNRK